jgi:hypothetical protein
MEVVSSAKVDSARRRCLPLPRGRAPRKKKLVKEYYPNMKTRSALLELLVSGLLVTSLLALTYMIGVAYYAGYLRGWGLPLEFMPLSRDGVLMQGAYALMHMGAALAVPLLAASLLVVLALVVLRPMRGWAVRSLTMRCATPSSALASIRHDSTMQTGGELSTNGSRGLTDLVSFSVQAVWIVLTGFSVFFALLWTMVGATRAGEAQARQDVDCSSCVTSELTFKDDIGRAARGGQERARRCSRWQG